MHRRFAKRRLTRVFLAAAVVFTLASVLTPEPTVRSTTTVASDSGLALGALSIQPAWRPAGAVLQRHADSKRPASVSTLPFGLAPRIATASDSEPRESLSRWHRIYTYSTRYRVKPDLARRIYDASVTAGIEPELGFRLVRVESVFNPRAQSPVGALGLTQLMIGTAREFEPNVTREELLDPDVNLRIGFRYLRGLIREYKGDLKLALLVYNRGPGAVHNAISMGVNPANGYESIVMRGYRGRGTLD
jgi:soluble lytic murein transglycosylase-like protein